MTVVVTTGRAITAILFVAALSVAAGCSDSSGQQAVPGSSKAAKLTQCVRPKEFMRRNHFELIQHQRDITVHQGVRATTDSLAACIACHVQYDKNSKPVPVNADGQFCNGCHHWLAVAPDCFGCHSTVPQGRQPSNLNKQWPAVFPAPVVKTKPIKPVVKPVTPAPVVPVKPAVTTAPVAPAVQATPVVAPAVQAKPVTVAPVAVAPVAPAITPTPAVAPVQPQTPPPVGN